MTDDPYPDFPRSASFATVIADPPWPFRQRFREAHTHLPYETMSEEAIFNLPVADAALPDAVLFLWTTNAHLPFAEECVRNWGFDQKTVITWVKTDRRGRPIPGSGFWFNGSTEHCLFAVRGKVPSVRTRRLRGEHIPVMPSVILSRRLEHSRKPAVIYHYAEVVGAAPRLELFARARRAGWAAWGNERTDAGTGPIEAASERVASGRVVA